MQQKMLQAAFQRAEKGRMCVICCKRVKHALYQRHVDECRVVGEDKDNEEGDNDGDIVFVGELKGECKRARIVEVTVSDGETLENDGVASVCTSDIPVKRNQRFRPRQPPCLVVSEQTTIKKSLDTCDAANQHLPKYTFPSLPTSNTAKCGNEQAPSAATLYGELMDKLSCLLNSVGYFSSHSSTCSIGGGDEPCKVLHTGEENSGDIPYPSSTMTGLKEISPHTFHYSLELLWQIIYEVLKVRDASSRVEGRDEDKQEEEGASSRKIAFWADQLPILHRLVHMEVAAQQLFIRLQLRRRKWHCLKHQKAEELVCIAADDYGGGGGCSASTRLQELCSDLQRNGFVEESSPATISMDEALNLAHREERKDISKEFRLNLALNLVEWKNELWKMARQRTLFGDFMEVQVIRSICKQLGPCYRIPRAIYSLMEALFAVYSPTAMDTAQIAGGTIPAEVVLHQRMIFDLLQVRLRRCFYPVERAAIVRRLDSTIYADYGQLAWHVLAKGEEQKIIQLLAKRTPKSFAEAVACGLGARAALEDLITRSEELQSHYQLPAHLRVFTASWVLTRCVSHLVEAYEKLRDYGGAVEQLVFLITNEALRPISSPMSRYNWYDRLTKDLDSHLKQRNAAIEWCLRALIDGDMPSQGRVEIEGRLAKMAPGVLGCLRLETVVPTLCEPEEIRIECATLRKGLGDGRLNHFVLSPPNSTSPSSASNKEICSVEEVALRHFKSVLGFSEGVHAEGATWVTIFELLCYDIIYGEHRQQKRMVVGSDSATTDITATVAPMVWLSELQQHPADIEIAELFYSSRKAQFDSRVAAIGQPPSEWLVEMVTNNYRRNFGMSFGGVSWSCFGHEVEALQRLVSCCPAGMLAEMCARLARDHRNTRSGFPDLTVWDAESRRLAVVEVKGPGDKLSAKQRLWLNFFRRCGVEAYVCHVAGKKERLLPSSTTIRKKT